MDWAALTTSYEDLRRLDAMTRSKRLTELRETDPEIATFLETRFATEDLDDFMMTSAPTKDDGTTDPEIYAAGTKLGPWRIEELIGTGGMGAVFRAQRDDGTYEQTVALKVSRRTHQDLKARFDVERQRLAELEHPNIARIIDGGTAPDGRAYMAVEYVDGAPIAKWCETAGVDRRKRVSLLIELCQAVSHAHGRLVLHRDIKSDNVLVDEVGRVRLIDFGISESLAEDGIAKRGSLTLKTAAPEQLLGQSVTVATDIFQLGMLAHLLLSGELPKRQSDGGVEISDNLHDKDLSAILDEALKSDPAARYQSVQSLSEDLSRWLAGEAVEARRGGFFYEAMKLANRNRLAAGLIGLVAISLAGGLTASLIYAQREQLARLDAEQQLIAAEFWREDARNEAERAASQSYLLIDFMGNQSDFGEEELVSKLVEQGREYLSTVDRNKIKALNGALGIAMMLENRGNYSDALDLLDAALATEDIPVPILIDLQSRYGRTLRQTGQTVEAAQNLREVLDLYEKTPFLNGSYSHAYVKFEYAMSTRTAADAEDAEDSLKVFMDTLDDDEARSLLYSNLANLAQLQGRVDRMADYLVAAYDISDDSDLYSLIGGDTRRLNLVFAILFGQQDVERAERYLPPARDAANSHIRTPAYRLWMMALMAHLKGEAAEAARLGELAYAAALEEHPVGERFNAIVAIQAAEFSALNGEMDAAEEYLAIAKPGSIGKGSEIRLLFARALIAHLYGRSDDVTSIWETLEAEQDTIQGNAELQFKYKRLKAMLEV